jgi:hypothetical protein
MTIGTWPSLWLLVLLLAVAASLTSYALSRVNALRGMRPAGRLAIAGATVLFLTAVTIALLSSSRWASLVPWSTDRPGDTRIAIPGRVLAIPSVNAQQPPQSHASEPGKATYPATGSRTSGPADTAADAGNSSPMLLGYASRAAVPPSPDMSKAGDCVRLFHRNPDNALRWTVENECGSPVAITVVICNESRSECASRGMVLPAKLQRPVFDADETVYGADVRFHSCFISGRARSLIGEPLEVRSTEEWRAEWEAARLNDPCLSGTPR